MALFNHYFDFPSFFLRGVFCSLPFLGSILFGVLVFALLLGVCSSFIEN